LAPQNIKGKEMKFTDTNISIFIKGDKSKQAVVFVHGFPYDHHMWDPVVEALSTDYFCVTYDIRGLGSSDSGDGQFTMEMFIDDLLEVIEKTGAENPVLYGLSMGGYISLRALERHENKFKAAILCDTKSEADNNQNKLKRAQAVKIINTKGLDTFLNEFIPTCFAEESVAALGREYEEIFNRSRKNSPVGVKGCLLAMAGRTDTTEYLNQIKIPVLLICGEKDKLTPPDIMKAMAGKIKTSEFMVIPESGHMTPIEQPDIVIQKTRSFLKAHNL
jgi:3-oxoadipate enol-lactonase